MKKLQAAMRDHAAKSWGRDRTMYKVGSYFKGCKNCGETNGEEGRAKRYLSGHDVFRSYLPKMLGWTYWCYTCGAKDHSCWEGAKDVGLEPVRGVRSAIVAHKQHVLKQTRIETKATAVPKLPAPPKQTPVQAMQEELRKLEALIRGMK